MNPKTAGTSSRGNCSGNSGIRGTDAALFPGERRHAASASPVTPREGIARTLDRYLLLNYSRTGKCSSSGIVEGPNRKVNLSI